MKKIAVVLAGGRGSRMNSDIPKQYLMLKGRPVLYYALKAFQDSDIDSIILAAGENDLEMCRTDRKSRRVGKECRSRWSPYH